MLVSFSAQRSEQKKSLDQQNAFLDKVVGDKKNMSAKKNTLEEQVSSQIDVHQ